MVKAIWDYLSLDDVTTAVAFLSLLLSFSGIIWHLVTERRCLRVHVLEYFYSIEGVYFVMIFENRSRLPLSITQITLCEASEIDCKYLQTHIGSHRKKPFFDGEKLQIDYYTMPLPICLQGLGAAGGYVLFDAPEHGLRCSSRSANFLIRTSRGRPYKMKLELPPALDHH